MRNAPNAPTDAKRAFRIFSQALHVHQAHPGTAMRPVPLTHKFRFGKETPMRLASFILLSALVLTAGCTTPPYSKPGQELAATEADYTDCYSQASLTANTPPFPDAPLSVVRAETDACMTQRGYQRHLRLF